MRFVRTLLRWFALGLLALAIGIFVPALTGLYGPYARRYATTLTTNPFNPAPRWYDTLETVRGAPDGGLPRAAPGEDPFRPGVLQAAADYAGAHASDALLVLHRGRVVFERYWNGKGPDSRFAAHSMTKTLAAILVGHAVADGRIRSIDDPVYFYIAEWDREPYRAITIRHLLNMSSGLDEGEGYWPWSPRMQRVIGTDIVAANVATPVAGPPGVSFAHINPPAQLLGVVLERATGRRFAEYLSEKFWAPLGASDAQLVADRPGGMVHTDCCMLSSIQDWARVGEALRTDGLWQGQRVIPARWPAQMVGVSPAYANFGLMLWLGSAHEPLRRYRPGQDAFANRHSEPFAEGVFWLDGLLKQRVWVVPVHELVIVRTGDDHPDWDDARIPNLLIRGMRP